METRSGEEEEIRRRQRQSARKSGKRKLGGKVKMEARQYVMFFGGCFLVSWGLVVTMLLLRLGYTYTFETIQLTRQEYVAKAAAGWAKSVASREVMQAIDVWNIINASIVGLVYRAPQDYSTLDHVLNPAFETLPTLHSVDLGYSDRTSEVSWTRQRGVGVRAKMRSNAADCFLMGVESCTPQELTVWNTPVRPDWFEFGLTLKPTPYGGIIYWAQKPELVVESALDGGDLLAPSIRLVFQTNFPEHFHKGAYTMVIGRITTKVASLGGDRLVDKRLGEEGRIYLCDATGAMLASRDTKDLLKVENGQVRYKYFWEVGKGKWPGLVREAFTGSSVKEKMVEEDGVFALVEPLERPLGRFAIIVVAPMWGPFQNAALIGTSGLAAVVAPAPYVIAGSAAFFFFWAQCFHTMRANDGKVGADFEQRGRVSVSATMRRVSLNGPGPDGVSHQESSRFGKFKKLATFMRTKSLRSSLGRAPSNVKL